MSEAETITKHYFISGRVQGVGFRAFTQRLADELRLMGWVRNTTDGRVEAMVSGPPEAMQAFEAHIRVGPPHGQVDGVEVSLGDPSGLNEFEIRGDG